MKPLQEYHQKRNFKKTPEPEALFSKSKSKKTIFVVQEHHASHLHYDFRLEMDGVLKSWAVPKGPSLDPSIKRLAVEVEDHPIPYANFEGSIPTDEYGGGEVFIWDRGTWEPVGDPQKAIAKGRLEFSLKGKKLKGQWMLLRTKKSSTKPQWLLIKRTDEYVQKGEMDIAMVHDHLNPLAGKSKSSKAKKALRSAYTKAKASVRPELAKETKKKLKKNSTKSERICFREPQLALLVDAPPEGESWIHETKYDGYRTQAHVDQGSVQLYTRSAQNWTRKYPTVARALEKLKVQNAVLDGEIVWIDENGRSDFQKLQNALKEKESTSILYYVFDLIRLNGEDLSSLPLIERKKKLEELLSPLKGTAVLYSEHLEGDAEQFLESSCDLSLEGIISKRKDATYASGRSDNWVKSKCQQRQEFVICGFTEGEGSRLGFGALLLGVYEEGKLRYIGRVGTGFSSDSLQSLRKKLSGLEQKKNPFHINAPSDSRIHWVKPELIAEVTFANWTSDGILRVPVFQGLREDKEALEIRREEAVHAPKSVQLTKKKISRREKLSSEKSISSGKSITHPEKIMFAEEETTKAGIARYYEVVSQWMLPHLSSRPLSLVRCPQGTSENCFFQKHASGRISSSVHKVQIKEKTASREYLTVDSVEGLWALVQQGTIEMHGWNCRAEDLNHPDQIVMDLDPGPGVSWKKTVAAAFAVKKKLEQMNLKPFVKVTGGKGIHVHAPIEPIYTWEQIKEFSRSFAQEMETAQPEVYTTTAVKKERHEKIYIDFLRNAQSATAVIPYSLRAKKVSSVALPVEWSELEEIPAASFFSLEKSLQKIKKRKRDPWKEFLFSAHRIPELESNSSKRARRSAS